MQHRLFPAIFACVCAFAPALSAADAPAPRPLQLPDIMAWRRIQTPSVSANGEWFTYRLAPAEGNAEVVIRNLKTGKEERLPAGDRAASVPAAAAAPGGGRGAAGMAGAPGGPTFSEDSKFVAFLAYPQTRDAKRMRQQRRPIQTRALLVELATGKKVEFEKVRRFAFSGERSTAIALQRYGAELGAPAGGRGADVSAPAGPGAAAASDRPTGTDLLLYDLSTAAELNLGNVADFAFDKKGNWMAYTIDATDKAGNGIELRNMATGAVQPLDSAAAVYRSISWTEKGDALAVLRGADDKAFEDKLYTLVAFKDLNAAQPTKVVYDPKEDKSFPAGMSIAATRPPIWREDLSAVIFGIHEVKPKKAAEGPGRGAATEGENRDAAAPARADNAEDLPTLVLWHWKDPRLQTQQEVQENQDRNFSYLCSYLPGEHKFVRLADEAVRQVAIAPEQKFAVGLDVRAYERESSLDGQRYEDVYTIDPLTGQRKVALRKARYMMGASPDGARLLYYDDGVFYAYDAESGKSTELTKQLAGTFWDNESDVNVVRPPRPSFGWTSDSRDVLISDGWDIWKVPVDGSAGVNLTVNGKKDQIRYRRPFRLDPDEKGIDLSKPVYLGVYGEWTKKGGIGLIEPGKTGVRMLQWDDAEFAQLLKAKHADTYLYTRENTKEYPNFYVADAMLANGAKVTDGEPRQNEFLWSAGVKIVNYTSTRGEKLQAALWLPANYEPGKHYPMMVQIYEKMSQNANQFPNPGYNGFSVAYYTSNGYAALLPDIVYKVNDPGMSAVACVVPAVKAAIASGVVDPARVGITGHSWGGYQTAFLVTQTDVFHAAVAGAPLTDMVSMYSLIYKNTGATNQAIFESSQGRFKGGYWENMDAYIRNSPVYHAQNVKTPLIILHNDRDGAVDQTQGIEYFNTLRRLGKPVILLEYKGENHGLARPVNMKDYTVRMKEFFDHYLMDKPAPKWMEDGIPLLKMHDELEQTTKSIEPPAEPASKTPGKSEPRQ
jgi:dipeptidyl aminopeptidase/acylaminoacyl peptidase